MTFPPEVWNSVLRRLQDRVPSLSYESWLRPIVPRKMDDGLELLCPSPFHRDRVRDCFLPLVTSCLGEETGHSMSVRVGIAKPATPGDANVDAASALEVAEASLADGAAGLAQRSGGGRESGPSRANSDVSAVRPDALGRMNQRSRNPNATPLARAINQTLQGTNQDASTARPQVELAAPSPKAKARRPRPSARSEGRQSEQRNDQRNDRARPGSGPRQVSFPLTFDSFTVGPCNALAKEAALAMSCRNQVSLNQLYLVSAAGLGKTHLARAVMADGEQAQGQRARYTTCDSFTTEFTHAVRNGRMADFKRKYRAQCDLLVVEDVQFLAGKAATQLEFFHTVQHLVDCGGRVLLTGDRYPEELTELESRVRMRIASGFVAEINAPDVAVRRNILRAKAAHGGIRIPDDCIELLVDRIKGNVRELEGALIQLVTTASLLKKPIDLALAQDALQSRRRRRGAAPANRARPEDIIGLVAVYFKTTPETLATRSRRRDVLHPRQLAMYLCRRFTDASLADIGRALNRDHPSVSNSIRKVERDLLEKVQVRYQVEALIDRLDELGYSPTRSATSGI